MWNNIIGSCGTGAFICRNEGPSGIARVSLNMYHEIHFDLLI